MKKKLVFLVLTFFLFLTTTKASSPAGFIYEGPSEAKQGETISYDLKVRDGNYFFVYSQDAAENSWFHEIEYDKNVLQFVSFESDMPEISISNNEMEETLTLKIGEGALGPYTEGQVIGEITFKVLESATLGEIRLSQPTGIDVGPTDAEMYKVVNILEKEDIENVKEETKKEIVKEDNNIFYILIGVLLLSNVLLAATAVILISKNKNK